MPDKPRIAYVVPHTLAFVREQILTAELLFDAISVLVTRPRPSWLERSWTRREEGPMDPSRFRVRHFFTPSGTSAGPYPFAELGLLRRHVPEGIQDVSLLHAHFLYPQGYLAMEWARKLEVPFIVTGHGYDIYRLMARNPPWRRRLLDVLSRAAAITTVSESNRATLEHFGVPSDRIQVVPNGFDPSAFYSEDRTVAREHLGLEGDHEIILYVGNLIPSKQVDRLIASFAKLRRLRALSRLVIVGGGPEEKRLRRFVSELGLNGSVGFAGETGHTDVAQWMRASDLLCLPSRMEGLPTVVVESLACGRPVVASEVGGIPSLLTKESGILVSPDAPEQLTAAIESALTKDWDVRRITSTVSRFARPGVRERWRAIYTSVLGGRPLAP